MNAREVMLHAYIDHGIEFSLREGSVILRLRSDSWALATEPSAEVLAELREYRAEIIEWLQIEADWREAWARVQAVADTLPEGHRRLEWSVAVAEIVGIRHWAVESGDPKRARRDIQQWERKLVQLYRTPPDER